MPYTYCVTHVPSGRRYYGVRTKRGCHPSDLWVTYFTSSRVVHGLIERDGHDSFTFEVRREFDSPAAALLWEDRVLRRLQVLRRTDWLNATIGGSLFRGPDHHSKKTKEKMSAAWATRVVSDQTRQKLSVMNTGERNPFFGKTHSSETKARISANHRTGDQTKRLEKMAGVFEITTPTGELVTVKNLSAYCRQHGLSQGNMTNVSKGRAKQHLGYKCRRLNELGGVFSEGVSRADPLADLAAMVGVATTVAGDDDDTLANVRP